MEQLAEQLKRHGIIPIGYQGLVICGADQNHPVMIQLIQQYIRAMLHSERQLAEVDRILTAFEEKGIDYLPLKGCNLKKIYPKHEFRVMGDADILIREEMYPAITEIMEQLGFESKIGADHTFNWRNNVMLVELHRRLVPVEDKDYLGYFGNGWSRAKQHSGHRWQYTPEDEFVFIFSHFARHFRFGGVGYRQFTDLWVYLRQYPNMDMAYIKEQMVQLQLDKFFENTLKAISAAFENGKADDITNFISDFVFNSGNWGDIASFAVSSNVKNIESGAYIHISAKFNTFIRAIFPSIEKMKSMYPILGKCPILLPVMWCVKWIQIVVYRRKYLGVKIKQMYSVTEDNIAERKKMYDTIGITYSFVNSNNAKPEQQNTNTNTM